MDFDFISDLKFRNLLKRDYSELEVCLKFKANKSVLILTGSIIEAILVEFFTNNLPSGKTGQDILKAQLVALIDLAFENKLISQRSKDLSTVIRNYRNLIHPGREIRENEKVDEDSAIVASSLLKIITSEIKENYLKKHGYTAIDIMAKLLADSFSYSIFEQLVERLNFPERAKLLNELTEHEIVDYYRNDEDTIHNVKDFVKTLKPFLSKEALIEQLNKLVQKVHTSEQFQIIKLYRLYHEDLMLLTPEDQELVITYILTYLEHHLDGNETNKFYEDKTFSSLGNYIQSPRLKKLMKDFIFKFIMKYNYPTCWYAIPFFYQIMNSFEPSFKLEVEEFIEKEIAGYLKKEFQVHIDEYNDNDIPF